MYEEYFGFKRTPFCRDLPPEDLFSTASTHEVNARLRYSLQQRFFMLLTGEVGSGKTTQIRFFAAGLNPASCRCLYIYDSDLTPRNFYWEALHQLGYEPRFYRGDAKRQLVKAVSSLVDESKKSLVMIIDEGHLLNQNMLEELRFLLIITFF
jgi:general secretion pathway protein A